MAIYYHGTSKTQEAESILSHGIRPGNKPGRGHLTPVQGRAYYSPELSYALIYAVGANMVGQRLRPESEAKTGFLFAVDGSRFGEVQPDEDTVGEVIYWMERKDGLEPCEFSPWNDRLKANLRAAPGFCGELRHFLKYAVTAQQYSMSKAGQVSWMAAAGKRALKTMSREMKDTLVGFGSAVSVGGTVVPDRGWRLPLSKCAVLTPRTGENFFAHATPIDIPRPLSLPADHPCIQSAEPGIFR